MELSQRRRGLIGQKVSKVPTDKYYLYYDGDTCDENSGGWTILDGKAQLTPQYIYFSHGAGKSIQTNKTFTNITRVGIEYERIDDYGGTLYSLRVFTGSKRNQLPSLPAHERLVHEFEVNSLSGEITIEKYYGTWRVYRLWIETAS